MRALPATIAATALILIACADDGRPGAERSRTTTATSFAGDGTGSDEHGGGDDDDDDDGGAGAGGGFLRALTPFADCSAFLDHVRAAALERVGPYGLNGAGPIWIEGDVMLTAPAATMAASADMPATEATSEAAAGGGDSSFTATNVQEVGIDEPDVIKTDGSRILVISDNVLSYVDVMGAEPVILGTLQLPEGFGHQLFFAADRALVITNGGMFVAPLPVDTQPVDSQPLDTVPPETTEPPVAATVPVTVPATVPVTAPLTAPASTDAEAAFAVDSTAPPAAPLTVPVTGLPPIEPIVPIRPDIMPVAAATVFEIDLRDPAAMTIAATLRVEGQYLSARAIGDAVRIALSSPPQQLPWLYPQTPAGEGNAMAANRSVIEGSTLSDWTPDFELAAGDGIVVDGGPLLACDRTQQPAEFSGFDMISILDLSLATGLADGFAERSSVGVLAGGQTVYSSDDRMYVATTKWAGLDAATDQDAWQQWSEAFETDVHAFALTPGAPTEYVASGSVAGSLLNQFSLDEHGGYLRAITTDGSPWDDRNLSESALVVMAEQGDQLVEVGRVGGIGKGETLYSARLLDDVGFAVTFRQVDPFYVLDLRDPTAPRIAGELKIPGFSTYLHPVGEDRVLGLGQDASEEGGTLGLKLSLFDVSDPSNPTELAVWTLPGANSPAEYDHRAFQMIGTTAIVPVQSWSDGFNGAILFEIGDASITEIGRVTHAFAAPTSDCDALAPEDLSDAGPYWVANDPYLRIQLCEGGTTGGYGSWYCEDLSPELFTTGWFGDPVLAAELLTANGIGGDSTIQLCYNDGNTTNSIQRSLVIDGALWTMSANALQANDLSTFDVIAALPL